MGAENSTPIVHDNDIRQENDPQRKEAFEVVKIPRADSNSSSNGTRTPPPQLPSELASPQQQQRCVQRVSNHQPMGMSSSGSSSSLESSADESLSTCQSPIPRSPESLNSTTKSALAADIPYPSQFITSGRETPPPPPPPPGPPPGPQQNNESNDSSYLPDMSCGISVMTESIAEFLDPANISCDQFVPNTKYLVDTFVPGNPMLNWWETEEAEAPQLQRQASPVITQFDMLMEEAVSLEMGGDLKAALGCYQEALELPTNSLEQMACVNHKMGVLHWKAGTYEESLDVLQLSMNMYQDAFGFSNSDDESWIVNDASVKAQTLSEVLNSLGRVHLSLGQLPQASRDLKQGLALVKIAHDLQSANDENTLAFSLARTKYGLGMVQDARGRPLRAKKYYQEAMEIYRSLDNQAAQVDLASCLNSMGAIHEQSQQYDDAMDCYTEALMIFRTELEQQHCSPVDVAVTLNNIGFMHHLFGEFDHAMKVYGDAVAILTSVLGESHRNVASTKHNIGLVHSERGAYQEALVIFKQVLKCQRDVLGEGHTDVAITLDSVAHAYQHLNKTARAIKYLERSLKIRSRALGKSHLLVAVTLDKLGKVLLANGDYWEAEQRLVECLDIYKSNRVEDGRIRHVKEYLNVIRSKEEIEQTISMNGQSYSSSSCSR